MIRAPVFLVILLTTLCACQPTPPAEDLLDDYLTRLTRVLDVERPAIAAVEPPRMPSSRALKATIEPVSIDLLEFWGFRKCGLAEILGERNSVLGRVMVPSQHLHMDGRILQQLRLCRQTLDDEALLALAGELEAAKTAQWPARYWNATAAAPELRAFWSPSSTPLVPGEEASYQEAEQALAFLTALPQRLQEGRWPTRERLETHYKTLERFELGGRLLQSLELSHHYIVAGNHMLEQAIDEKTLCPGGLQKKELDYARNVMLNVFVGEVQPWLAAIHRRSESLTHQYTQLLNQQTPNLRKRLAAFESSLLSTQSQLEQALRRHVAHWQRLFETCGSKARQ